MAKRKIDAATVAGPRVYVGPTIPKTALTHNTVFSEDFPPFMEEILELYPEVLRLIVPVSEMHTAQTEVADVTTYKSRMARVIKDKIAANAKGGEK